MGNIITFEQAKILKQLGFDRPTQAYYENCGYLITQNESKYILPFKRNSSLLTEYSAPTVAEALDFIRVDMEIECGVYPNNTLNLKELPNGENGFDFVFEGYGYIYLDKNDPISEYCNDIDFDSHPIAENMLFSDLLIYLQKKISHNKTIIIKTLPNETI